MPPPTSPILRQPDPTLAAPGSLYDVFLAKFLRALAARAAPASAACAVRVGAVRGRLRNCELMVLNRCHTDASDALALASEALAETLAALPQADRIAVANELGVDPKAPKLLPDPACASAESTLAQNVDIQTLNLGDCGAPDGRRVRIALVNSGHAAANCALARVATALARRTPVRREGSLASGSMPPWSVLLSVATVTVIGAVAVSLLKRALKLRFRFAASSADRTKLRV
ncbi:vaccinia virus F9L-like protein [Seal parapoxvirus]|uniref:Vaccinia virus F9L-like protein n=1 Tax=Seal parapoxvirus TaxID=187984 RepID=A0A1Z3GCM6_9POXV|nr:vaccinia virus F9L-like protein [Seal parapoxvirus]ASC55521.1 vaccinia virus F9L-like protein [Seal parapoxvirus]